MSDHSEVTTHSRTCPKTCLASVDSKKLQTARSMGCETRMEGWSVREQIRFIPNRSHLKRQEKSFHEKTILCDTRRSLGGRRSSGTNQFLYCSDRSANRDDRGNS